MLTLIDEHSRECLAIDVGRRLNNEDLLERLTWLMSTRGVPTHIRSDNGSEFTAKVVRHWLSRVGVTSDPLPYHAKAACASTFIISKGRVVNINLLNIMFVCTSSLIGCSVILGDISTSETRTDTSPATARIDFGDPIPSSPSMTMPEKIHDGYWHGQFQRVNREVAAAKGTKVVFFGDSITLNWSSKRGKEIWNKHFSKYKPINMGNSGDITPVMLYRIAHGNLNFPKGKHPQVAVLLCGTNNFAVTKSAGGKVKWDLGANCPPEDVAHGVRAIAQEFRRRLPKTRLIIMGILPVANEAKRKKCRQVNEHLANIHFEKDEVVYVDLWHKYMSPGGSLNKDLFTDGTHLTEKGYRVWAAGIKSVLAESIRPERSQDRDK